MKPVVPQQNSSSGPRAGLVGIVALFALTWAGCENLALPHQAWTQARVAGRVLDGTTRQPVAGAAVTRWRPSSSDAFSDSSKGGPKMASQPAVAVTDADGRFELIGERTAQLFLETFPDFTVTLRVRASGYAPFQQLFTNVTFAGPKTNEPLVNVGDILLVPAANQ
jgi:hypothetical protein